MIVSHYIDQSLTLGYFEDPVQVNIRASLYPKWIRIVGSFVFMSFDDFGQLKIVKELTICFPKRF